MTRRTAWPPPCSSASAHTNIRGTAEASRMWRTHEQQQCPECNLWVIWMPLPEGSLVVCWSCGERNVDPAALGEDDEPLCADCIAKEAEWLEAQRQARLYVRWIDAT